MEKHLKERLVGAGVLVAIGVILIPLLLDGPEPQHTRRIGLELPGAGGDHKTHVIRVDESGQKTLEEMPAAPDDTATGVIGGIEEMARDPEHGTAEAEAAGEESAAADPDPEPAPAVTPVRAEPRPPEPTPAPSAPAGDWFVQVGSFSDPANARRLREGLVKAGYDVRLSEVTAGGRTLHRVRVGPVNSREEGDALAARLARAGHKGRVVSGED